MERSLLKEYLRLKNQVSHTIPFTTKHIKLKLWTDRREELKISPEDFERDTPAEKQYLYKYRTTILRAFDNRCAICLAHDKGIEMDHHYICKADGGTFGLAHRTGVIINNAVPLCVPCNRRKKDKSYKLFCSKADIERIKRISSSITQYINMTTTEFSI